MAASSLASIDNNIFSMQVHYRGGVKIWLFMYLVGTLLAVIPIVTAGRADPVTPCILESVENVVSAAAMTRSEF